MSMTYYIESCGRTDIEVVPLYDLHYVPRDGDLIVLEPSRRFFETQRFFDALENSGMSHRAIPVGPVLASTIYLFDTTVSKHTVPEPTLTQLQESPTKFHTNTQKPGSVSANGIFAFLRLPGRSKQ
jgi:hypothetical protein